MDPKEQLKSMLQSLINDDEDQANATIHQYIVAKTQQLTNIGAPAVPAQVENNGE